MTPRIVPRAQTLGRPRAGRVWVTCWCERAYVQITRGLVARGLTASCGRDGCESSGAGAAGVQATPAPGTVGEGS